MAEQKSPALEYPSSYPEKIAFDVSKLNPMGVGTSPAVTASVEEAMRAQKELADSLERRFSQPNWFKVAEAFGKPQLGGFIASLGSAAGAMGQQQEAQRAIAPTIARMRAEIAAGQVPLAQRGEQKKIFEKAKSENRPLTPAEIQELSSYGKSDIADAAMNWHQQAEAALRMKTAATAAMGKDPLMELQEWTDLQLKPGADPNKIKERENQVISTLNAAKPPQIEQATWEAMPRYDKIEAANSYARAQREAGMGAEASFQQNASQAPSRLSLLGSIRDLALGVGVPDVQKNVDGKPTTITGQQQIAALLNKFGGNNPFEVFARAAADGKLGDRLKDIDVYARQNEMSPAARDTFQKLVKLLAENQISLRNSAVNPTDASAMLQAMGSPNIGNSQTALLSLVDLMGHSEQNAIEKYKYVLDNKVPFRYLGVDPGYLEKQRRYAEEHRQIATQNPLVTMPSWYNPARSNKPQERPAQPAEQATPQAAPATQAAPAAQRQPGRPVTLSDIQKELERRQKARGQQ